MLHDSWLCLTIFDDAGWQLTMFGDVRSRNNNCRHFKTLFNDVARHSMPFAFSKFGNAKPSLRYGVKVVTPLRITNTPLPFKTSQGSHPEGSESSACASSITPLFLIQFSEIRSPVSTMLGSGSFSIPSIAMRTNPKPKEQIWLCNVCVCVRVSVCVCAVSKHPFRVGTWLWP